MDTNLKLTVAFLAAVFFMSMDSDDAEAQPAVRFDAGAVNFTSISFQEALDMETCWSPGVQLGFEYDIRVKKRFYITPGLTWSWRSAIMYDAYNSDPDLQLMGSELMSEHFLNLPVHFKWNFDIVPEKFAIFLYIGPVFSAGLASSSRLDFKSDIDGVHITVNGKYDYYSGSNNFQVRLFPALESTENALKKAMAETRVWHGRFQMRLESGVGFRIFRHYEMVLGSDLDLHNRYVGDMAASSILQSSFYYVGFRYRFGKFRNRD